MTRPLIVALALFAGTCGPPRPPVVTPPPVETPPQPEQPPAVVLPVHNAGGHFATSDGQRWYWKFATDFQLLKYELEGTPYDQILDQRQRAGANGVRVFGMAKNLFDLNPAHYGLPFYDGVDRLLTTLAARGMYVELTVFADALLIPEYATTAQQLPHWDGFRRFAGRNLFLELVNENSHAGNTINVQAFPFLDGILCAHGSEQTDVHPIEPHWNYVLFHARRDGPPDSRGASNYSPYVFESPYPKDRPWIADEGIKSTDAAFMRLAGQFAGTGDGGTCHTQSGVTSQVWTEAEAAACAAFFQGVH